MEINTDLVYEHKTQNVLKKIIIMFFDVDDIMIGSVLEFKNLF